ncbi:hypothetical protein FQN57_002271 [Myotisia sp. PD_48]|nr:hypothetical protein FQN57_002271 [Myotisia sp. PD_48]
MSGSMMLFSLPAMEPRDSHTLWYSSSAVFHDPSSSNHPTDGGRNQPSANAGRRHNRTSGTSPSHPPARTGLGSFDRLSSLMMEETALRTRKQNIASFGYSWIRPAGFSKTMLGIREEEMEREEGAAAGESGAGEGEFMGEGEGEGTGQVEGEEEDGEDMERDLDGDIPDADEGRDEEDEDEDEDEDEEEDGDGQEDTFGLVEEGETAFDTDDEAYMRAIDDEDQMMMGDLDDDIPEAGGLGGYSDDEEEEQEGEDNDGEQDEAPPIRPLGNRRRAREPVINMDPDSENSIFPNQAEGHSMQQGDWEHTDSDEEIYDDEDDDDDDGEDENDMDVEDSRISLASLPPGMPQLGPRRSTTNNTRARQESEAERSFIDRWTAVESSSAGPLPENQLYIPRRRSRRHSYNDPEADEL